MLLFYFAFLRSFFSVGYGPVGGCGGFERAYFFLCLVCCGGEVSSIGRMVLEESDGVHSGSVS